MNSSSFWPQWNDRPVFVVLLVFLFVASGVWACAGAYKTFREASRVGYGEQVSPSISVSAEGEAVIKNDIATVDIGITKVAASASGVQTLATDSMNALTAALKALGIAADDLQTSSYTVYPRYDYDQSPSVIVGYEANQTLTVKIRDSALVNSVLGKAGELGVTNIGSLRFEADDDTVATNAARAEALAKARSQAEAIASAMGVTLGEVLSYSETANSSEYPLYRSYADSSMAMGGGALPDVQMGQSDVRMYVNVNYAIK